MTRGATYQESVILAAVVFSVVAASGCELLEGLTGERKPEARVTGTRLRDLSLEGVDLLFDVEVTNPYPVDLPLVNLDYELLSRDRRIVGGKAPLEGTVPSGGARTLELPAAVTFLDVLAVLKDVRPGAVVPYEARLGLSVDAPGVGPLRLPLSREGDLPIPTVPEVELRGVRWERLSLDEAAAVLDLHVVNANEFAVGLSRLDYDLDLGGARVARGNFAEPVDFGAGDGKTLKIGLSVTPRSLGLAAFRMLMGEGAKYALKGNLSFDTPFGPLELPYQKSGDTPFRR